MNTRHPSLFPLPDKMDKKSFLMIALVVVFYILSIFASLYVEGPLGNGVGLDFRAFWSAGKVANTYGYKAVYDMDRMEQIQQRMVENKNPAVSISIAPVSYFAAFFPLFQLFALVPPVISFYLWSLITVVGTFLYLRFLFKELKIPSPEMMAFLGVLSYPSFTNLYWGQLGFLLVVFVGEFIRNARRDSDFLAGLWIGGLVPKPQLLILVCIVLLIQRKWKMTVGFLLTILTALTLSLALAGLDGFSALLDLFLKFSAGMPTNAPEYMINWRMLGELLGRFFPTSTSWWMTAIGMGTSTVVVFLLWRKPVLFSSTEFMVAFSGTMAATLVITWHSHTHAGMILIPGMMLMLQERRFTPVMFYWWQFFLPLFLLLLILPLEIINIPMGDIPELVPGIAMFLFNLFLLGWAWKIMSAGKT